jgi:peptidoglycan/xylan/chitin deacetylase (PgdA/CDA1 family)
VPPQGSPVIVSVLPTSSKVVALTFDGGAGNEGAAKVAATLRAQGVPASFFVTGKFAAANPSLVADLATIGPVGNHSWDHPHFTTLTDSAVQAEVAKARAQISAVTGKDPVPFFRFPFGESDARTRALVAAAGYREIGWTVDSLGWEGTSGGQSVDKVIARVVAAARPGEIVLMHLGAHPTDHSTLDADALGQVIAKLRAAGYSFVTLDSLR